MPGPQLLVSVRDAAEAVAAIDGGADLIDVKEPSRGSLGRADAATIVAIVQAVAGRVPVSAALGELRDWAPDHLPADVQFVKWGLSGLSQKPWKRQLSDARPIACRQEVVAVAYADWVRAESPRPADLAAHVAQSSSKVLLIDTFDKDGSTLLDWLSIDEVKTLVQQCQKVGKRVALAGSLTAIQIDRLGHIQPDWFAVRGAVCDGGRNGIISEQRVRELANLTHAQKQ